MVPAGTCEVGRRAGDPGTSDCTQTASRATYRCGIKYPRDFARLRAEGWPGNAEDFRSADPRAGCGSAYIKAHCRRDAFGAIGLEGRVRKATQGCAGNCA